MKTESLSSQNFSRILLIKPSALGDVVHTIPVLPKLRVRFPSARIDWLITPENAGLVRDHPDLSGIVLFNRQKFGQLGRDWTATTEPLRLLGQLREANYDLVIDLHGQMRSALITLATGAPVRVGFGRPVRRTRSTAEHHALRNIPRHGWTGAREGSWVAYSHHIPIPTLDVHAIDRYLWLIPIFGLDDSPIDSRIYLSAEIEEAAQRFLEHNALHRFVALVPGTTWETKHWHPERFAAVGRWLKTQGFGVLVLGSKRDRLPCEQIAKLCGGAIDYSGRTTAAELAALVKQAAVCVTNDSGAMHLAIALERPVVSVFGPTNPVQIGPYRRPRAVVRADLACSPCNFRRLSQCPHGHACMAQVSAAAVIERVESELSANIQHRAG
ncbi:MAG: glycosyltransferase family 9 protein [Verrucomicrobia bacterium]|nr:glycosyltransferase family 9 protein [Verrucomicrobiota bacterium]MBV8533460.1 glycosyltransferase family 9 protein [Verrucomicrobiota bacterium]